MEVYKNSVIMQGYIAVAPHYQQQERGMKVCTFRLFVEKSCFTVKAFGSLADNCMRKFTLGTKVRVSGRLKQDRWLDENDKPVHFSYIIANTLDILDNTGRKIITSTVFKNSPFGKIEFPQQNDSDDAKEPLWKPVIPDSEELPF